MSEINGLQVAADLAKAKRDAVAQLLAQARQQWIAAQMQLDQLESYAQECMVRWGKQQLNCSPEVMKHHYQFMARLDHAIGLQTGIAGEHGKKVEREAATLREAESRLESLRQLMAQREREQQLVQSRREQKVSDEQAAILHRRRTMQALDGLSGLAGGLQ